MSSSLGWFKSSYSNASGGECIEVAVTWSKSSYSSDNGGNCVEIATCCEAVHVRDSKAAEGPSLTVAPGAWAAFLAWEAASAA